MDTVTQFTLGAAVGVAVLGRRTALWKAALWGGLCGTLPDLDTFVPRGDPVSAMTLHRAETHALFWLTLASPLIAWLPARLHRADGVPWRRWWLAVWLALVTHPLLDAMTVYGTQLGLPFTDFPFALGSIFIIDPAYTLPLLAGLALALARGRPGYARAGLVVSSAYLAWSALAQAHVAGIAEQQARAQGIGVERLLVNPGAFNTLLWRIVVVSPDGRYHEAFHSLLDPRESKLRFDSFDAGRALADRLAGHPPVARMRWFARDFVKLERNGTSVVLSDLRMGMEPAYIFAFEVARIDAAGALHPVAPRQVGRRPELARTLAWMGRRMLGEPLPPPR
jgi:inner membrane protein